MRKLFLTVIGIFASMAVAADARLGPFKSLDEAPDVMSVFEIIPEKSRVEYYGMSNAHDFRGTTGAVSGRIEGNPRRMEQTARVEIRVKVASFDSGEPRRDKKMQKVVESDTFPEAVFISRSLKVIDQANVPKYKVPVEISGTLTFHGKSQELTAPVVLGFNPADYTMSAEGIFPVDMTKFGVDIPSLLFFKVEDVFTIKFKVLARLVSPRP